MAKTDITNDNSAKLEPKEPIADKKTAEASKTASKVAAPKPYEPSELVIKEIMVQKNCTREKAIQILKNPSK